jgi:hypothetical protein
VVAGTVTSTVAVDSSSNSVDVNFTVLDIFISELMLFFSLQVIVGAFSVLNSFIVLSASKTHSIFVTSLMSILVLKILFICTMALFNEVDSNCVSLK